MTDINKRYLFNSLSKPYGGLISTPKNSIKVTPGQRDYNITELPKFKSGGNLIKRANGSYSQRGLWDNIRANKGSGKAPTKQMLEQERKIKNKYAEGGILETLKSNLNPYNWGVNDYTNKGNFNTAYSSAKKTGEKEFMYKGKRYNTKYAGTPRQEVGTYGVDGKPVHPMDLNHPAQVNLYPAFGKYLPGHISASIGDNKTSIDYSSTGNFPFGINDVKNKGEKSFNVYGQDNLNFSNKASSLPTGDYMLEDKYTPSDWNLFTNNCADNVCDAFGIPRSKGIETPTGAISKIKEKYPTIDVTGRTYDDYENLYKELQNQPNKKILLQSKNILGIASSPDLQQTDISKKLISTIQGVLADEGFAPSKSQKQSGGYDGIYGPETKQALLDYQTKLKTTTKKAEGGWLDGLDNKVKFEVGGTTSNNLANAAANLAAVVQQPNEQVNKKAKAVDLNYRSQPAAASTTFVNNNIIKQKAADFAKDVKTYGSPEKALLAKANRENINKGTLAKTQNINPNDRWMLGAANYRGDNPEQVINANKQTQAIGALAAGVGAVGSIPVVSQALGAGFAAKGIYDVPETVRTVMNPNVSLHDKTKAVVFNSADFLGVGEGLKGAKAAGKYLTEETALKNAYKLNPWSFKPNPEAYYRTIGDKVSNGIKASKLSDGMNSFKYDRPYFYKGDDLRNLENFNHHGMNNIIAEVKNQPMKLTRPGDTFTKEYRPDYYPVDANNPTKHLSEIPISDDVRFLKKDWLKGYKEVPKPTTASSAVDNVKPSFKSEIDWNNWNKEIPENKGLMQEYNAIEQQTKANGSWMKNPDGSIFQGTPEQFVQQNSSNFKNAFPKGHNRVYRGGDNENLSNREHPIVFTGDKKIGEHYVGSKSPFTGGYETASPDAIGGRVLFDMYHPKSNNSITINNQGRSWREIPRKHFGENPPTKDLHNLKGDFTSTDDIAKWMVKNDKNSVRLNNIFDSYDADFVDIINHKPGSYLKSAIGNNGMFDMTNPNIYKTLVPAILGTAALQQNKKSNGGWLDNL